MVFTKKFVVFFFFFVLIVCEKSKGRVYTVGDSAGWTNVGHLDYKTWAATKTFHVGDIILFEYNKEFHNVVRVTHKHFHSCNSTAAYETFASGKDSFVIRKSGHFFFICNFTGHCESGQKVDIRVPGAHSSSPSLSPIPSPPTPSQPRPSPPTPSQPQPTPSTPSQPLPSPPTPSQPHPSPPTPSHPTPSQPLPSPPTPTPSPPTPSQPLPSPPTPSQPQPSPPTPSQPLPSPPNHPTPSQPLPSPPTPTPNPPTPSQPLPNPPTPTPSTPSQPLPSPASTWPSPFSPAIESPAPAPAPGKNSASTFYSTKGLMKSIFLLSTSILLSILFGIGF